MELKKFARNRHVAGTTKWAECLVMDEASSTSGTRCSSKSVPIAVAPPIRVIVSPAAEPPARRNAVFV
jgi:hypothetical protein